MKKVRYARPRANFSRRLRVSDLENLGIPHKDEDLVWNQANGFEIVMSNRASDLLVEKFPKEFILFDAEGEDETPEVLEPMTSIAGEQLKLPEDEPELSVADPAAEKRSSTRSKTKDA